VLKKLAPERWEPYMLEATLQRRLKKYEKAEAAIKTASSLEKNFNPELHYWHYMIAYSLKKYDEAAAIVDELMEKAPEDKWALLAAARYCSNHQKQYEKALELCSKAIEKDPDFYEAYLLESALYSYMKDRKASIAAGKKAIELRPTACAAAYHNIAIQMRLLGNLSTALAYAEKGIELFPGLIELRLRKIQILIDMGLYDNLTGEIAQLMKMAPENANPYQYEVDIDIAQGNFAEARRATWKFYEFLNLRESDSAAAYNNLAWRFYLLGTDLQTARECSGKSLKGRVPAGRYDTLCHILSALGDKKSFDEAAAKLLSVCANDAEKVSVSLCGKAENSSALFSVRAVFLTISGLWISRKFR
jgi:tetratricopeptide (TPR) repeat protein